MTLVFSFLTLLMLLAVTLVAQSTGMVVTNYFMLIAALVVYVGWKSRKSVKVSLLKRGRSAA
ncbi:hypothetical protein [Reinekea marinisedimentorum]|uniref:Uncharacterized protein n=1 Tax=Reinekea marinisedimentorum TaxID=230495 RepID=A0A4R3HRY7_9GAMM|nr:hypothetical protein [Reinekea marinisedimentorum]TCS35897.1 hypothetical protein BCF53_12913 [Reinekea marinisedimentorum]